MAQHPVRRRATRAHLHLRSTALAAITALGAPAAVHAQDAAPAAAAPTAAASAPPTPEIAASTPAAAAEPVAPAASAARASAAPATGATPQQLPEVKVQSTPDAPFRAEVMSSPKFTQPLLDTPQTITVITRELIQQRNATTLTETLRNTPGITLLLGENGNTQTGDAIVMRGFDTSSSIFVDNIRDLGAISRDVFNIDQVEVVKGPSGADNGRGASSGYVNLVTKAPTLKDVTGGSVMVGDADRRRVTADVSRRFDIGLPGTAWRLNVVSDEGGVPGRDQVENQLRGIAPSLAIGLGTPTRATFYFLHTQARNVPDGGVPTIGLAGFADAAFATGGALAGVQAPAPSSSNFYGSHFDRNEVDMDMFTARVEHDFSPTAHLANTSRLAHAHQLYAIGGFSGTTATSATTCNRTWFDACDADPANWTVVRNRQITNRTNDILTNQTNLSAEFVLAGLTNHFSGGVELAFEKQNTPTLTSPGTLPVANLLHPNIDDNFPPFALGANGVFSKGSTLTASLYGFNTLTVNEQVKLNAGLRWDKFSTDFDSAALSTLANQPGLPENTLVPTSLSHGDQLLSWKVGALYKPQPNGSAYVSWSNSKFPPASATFGLNANTNNANNPIYDPQEGTNIELGTKWDLLDGKLAVAGAVFRSENTNELVQDPVVTTLFTQVGKRRVQGVELSAAGAVTPQWDLNLGLGWMDAKILRGFTGAANPTDGGLLQWTPEWSFTAWAAYKVAPQWTLAGGARYIDAIVRSSVTAFTTAQSGLFQAQDFWVTDAMATYQWNRNVALQLNVFNLLDKAYVGSLNNSGKRYIPGQPRSLQLSANFNY